MWYTCICTRTRITDAVTGICDVAMTYILETLGLSMELNDDILVQTTSLQTIARVKRVECCMLHKVP